MRARMASPPCANSRTSRRSRPCTRSASARPRANHARARATSNRHQRRRTPASAGRAARASRLPAKRSRSSCGQVDPAALEVARHVLPAVGELERGADLVGARLALRVAVPEQPEHDAADRVRRAAAVLEQVRERRAWRSVSPAASRRNAVSRSRNGSIGSRCAAMVWPSARKTGSSTAARSARAGEQLLLVCREAVEPAGGIALVRQVVAAAREGVHRRQVAAQPARQEKRPDREVLVVGAGDPGALGVRLLDARGGAHHVDGSTRARYCPSARSGTCSGASSRRRYGAPRDARRGEGVSSHAPSACCASQQVLHAARHGGMRRARGGEQRHHAPTRSATACCRRHPRCASSSYDDTRSPQPPSAF